MGKFDFENDVKWYISCSTVVGDPKIPVKHYIGHIDGKLYKSRKGKTVWNRRNDIVNSLRHNSPIFGYLRGYYTNQLWEEHPEYFVEGYSWPYVKPRCHEKVEKFVDSKLQAWWDEHVEIIEIREFNN